MRTLANQGKAVLMISSELPEIIGMSDRIAVFHRGRVVGEMPGGDGHRRGGHDACDVWGTRMMGETARSTPGANRWSRMVDDHRELLTISAVLLALVIIAVVATPNFSSSATYSMSCDRLSPSGLVSVGQTAAILVGGSISRSAPPSVWWASTPRA